MYQAMQNGIFGFGAIAGASLGGTIADQIGWRWCFLSQVPLSIAAFIIGYKVVKNQQGELNMADARIGDIWKKVDITGAVLLVVAVSTQLLGLSLGGNELPWSSPWVIAALLGSLVLFVVFVRVEATTSAIPIIPLRLLWGRLPVATQLTNVCAGLAAYAVSSDCHLCMHSITDHHQFLFMVPLYFQVVLLESATKAGARLAIPSLATPIGGLISGVVMSRWGKLLPLVRLGAVLMVLGNGVMASLAFKDAEWKYYVYIFPASLGQGIIYPAILFTSLASFEHAGRSTEILCIAVCTDTSLDHAVSASTVYLIRSLGTVWGVSVTSAIVQSTLSSKLPAALGDIPNKSDVRP
jgi:hypothetical protein